MPDEMSSKDNKIEDSNKKIDSNSTNYKYTEPKSYAFNGKVIIGIGIIMAISATITIFMAMFSQSPQIHLSVNSLITSTSLSPQISQSFKSQTAVSQLSTNQSNAHPSTSPNLPSYGPVKKIILIQQDFGWNGTYGGPPIILNKGDNVQLLVINRGHMAHNFGIATMPSQVLDKINKQNNEPLDKRIGQIPYNTMADMPCPGCQAEFEKGHIKLFIEPGTQQVSSFVADKVGQFKYFCMVRGHLWLGMIGNVIVRDNPGATTVKNSTGNV
jgi:FtsP/CotA-like multicopper oxidase with cupredoxin domain